MMTDHDEERERHIQDEAIIDAYRPEEQALSWYFILKRA
jgi:hypothetical protein